jgi:hypothetical protein
MLLLAGSLTYMVVLGVLATASPGIGILGWILLMLPGQLLDCLHAPAYGFLAWLSMTGLYRRRWPFLYALAAGSFFALLFGLWTETLQGSVPGRGSELKDLVVDGVGIVMAAVFVLWHSGNRGIAWITSPHISAKPFEYRANEV